MSDGQTHAADIETDIRRRLLTYDQVQHYQNRVGELLMEMASLEMAGSPEKVSQEIGIFQLLKGKKEAFEEIMEDHNAAAEQLKPTQSQQQ